MPEMDIPTKTHDMLIEEIDALNKEAYLIKANSPANSELLAKEALEKAYNKYPKGVAKSLWILGFLSIRAGDFHKGIQYGRESLEVSKRENFKQGTAGALSLIGSSLLQMSRYEESIQYIEQAMILFEELGETENALGCSMNIARVYQEQGKYKQAIDIYTATLNQAKQFSNREFQSSILNNLGNIYNYLGEYEKSLKMHYDALNIRYDVGDNLGVTKSRINIAAIYLAISQVEKSRIIYEECLLESRENNDFDTRAGVLQNLALIYAQFGEYEKSNLYINEALESHRKRGNIVGEVLSLRTLAFLKWKTTQNQEAFDVYEKCLELHKNFTDKYQLITTLNSYSEFLCEIKNYEYAEMQAKKAYCLADEGNHKKARADALRNLSNIYEQKGDLAQALHHFKRYHELKEQVFNEESDKRLKNLQVLHDVEQARLSERESIRSKLHGDVLSAITRIHRWSTPLRESLDALPDHLRDNAELIYETAKSLDMKVRHFQFGLSEKAKSVYEVCKHLEKLSVEILEKSAQFEVCGIAAPMREKEMTPSVRDALTDIVQLAMTNIWKHAEAAHVKMNFKLNSDVFEMDICDDGKGFNVDDAPAIGGVSDMKDIARRIGATLNIDSIPKNPLQNGGTKITFFLTLNS